MTDDRSLERAARSWLEEGPTRAPDRAVEAALSRIQTTTQERDLRIPWRFPTMNPIIRIATVALVAALALGGVYLAFRPTTQVGPQTPSVAPSASPQPSLNIALLQSGTFVSPTLQVADIEARMNADSTLTAADRTQVLDVFLDARGKATISISITFYGGQLTQRETVDGRTVVGSFGRYAFPDNRTLVYTETIDGTDVVTEFEIAVAEDSFTLHRTTPVQGAADEFVTRLIFESGPFTLR